MIQLRKPTFFYFLMLLLFSSIKSYSEIIQLKFRLKNFVDSTSLNKEKILITPIVPYLCYYDKKDNQHKKYISTSKIKYDEINENFIFEYNSKYYPHKEIFLSISIENYTFERESKGDYDEERCVELNIKNLNNISNFYFFPFRSIQIVLGKKEIKKSDCLFLNLVEVYGKDTVCIDKFWPEKAIYLNDSIKSGNSNTIYLNEKIHYSFNEKFILRAEIYNNSNYSIGYYKLSSSNKIDQIIYLDEIDFLNSKLEVPQNDDCLKYDSKSHLK